MTVQTLCQWLYEWPPAVALRESDDLFPIIETAHVLSICMAAGTILAVDFRLLGWALTRESAVAVTKALLPLTWLGFILMLSSGVPLFAAEALQLYANPAFRVKLILLGIAGANALAFHGTVFRSAGSWAHEARAPASARGFAAVSVITWAGIIVSGRLIAVFHGH